MKGIMILAILTCLALNVRGEEELIDQVKPDIKTMVKESNQTIIDETLDKAFQIYDVDKDGQLNFQELFYLIKAASKSMKHKFPGKETIKRMIAKIDEDKNGKVNKDELKLLLGKMGEILKQEIKLESELEGESQHNVNVKEDL